MEPLSLALFSLALIVNAGTPGPSIAALVSRVITHGWRDVAPFVAAMWLGEVVWLTCVMAGLSTLAEAFGSGFVVLKYLGVAYLCWLAWKMWHQPVGGEGANLPRRRSGWSMFLAGMTLTLGNPKIMVFYLALLPTLIDLSAPTASFWLIAACITLTSLALVDLTWIAAAHWARAMLRTPRSLRLANRVGATAMGGAALMIASR